MSDLDKLFENAPEGATEIVAWGNNLTWANETKMYSLVREYWVERDSGWQTIATRPQPERKTVEYAVVKSEPEWTHISTGGNKCRYLMETVHGDLYENEWGTKFIPGFEGCNSVEPIKPKITKAEHEFLCKFSADVNDIHVVNSVESYLAKHEVVE